MIDVPDKAIYRCPEHGLFMVETKGIVWRQRSCTYLKSPVFSQLRPDRSTPACPCGILSPLANVDDPDLTDQNKNIGTLTPEDMTSLRQSIERVRAARAQERERDGDKPNYMFGGSENRRNGHDNHLDWSKIKLPEKDVEQELFEVAERERMRAAMDTSWDDKA